MFAPHNPRWEMEERDVSIEQESGIGSHDHSRYRHIQLSLLVFCFSFMN